MTLFPSSEPIIHLWSQMVKLENIIFNPEKLGGLPKATIVNGGVFLINIFWAPARKILF